MKNLFSWLPSFYKAVVRCLFALLIIGLFLMSMVCIAFIEPSEYVYLCDDAAILQFAAIAVLCGILFFLSRSQILRRWDLQDCNRWLEPALLMVPLVLGTFWVLSTRFGAQADQATVMGAAHDLRIGDFSLFEKGGYMARYPHQTGLVLLLYALSFVWGDFNYTAFQLMNVLAYVLIVAEMGLLCKSLGMKRSSSAAAMLLGIFFLPLLFYTSFTYGSMLSLAASLLALRLTLDFFRTGKLPQAFGAGSALFFAVVFKSNAMVFGIGLIIYTLIWGLQKQEKGAVPLFFILLLGFFASKTLPIVIGEAITGCDLSHGLSPLTWVVMGLQDDGNQIPGWYNGYVWSSFTAAGEDPALHKAIVLSDLRTILLDFAKNPRHMVMVFAKKTAAQWCDPTFQSIWILQNMPQQVSLPAWAETLITPQASYQISRALNILHIWLLFGAMLCALTPGNRDNDFPLTLLMMIFIGGFVFHSFWEAKSEYTFPYFSLLIPLSVSGFRTLVPICRNINWRTPFRKDYLPLYLSLSFLILAVLASHFLPTDTLQVNLVRFYRSLQ